jgi:hypothetical protein
MEGLLVAAVLVFLLGGICGIVAVLALASLRRRIDHLEQRIDTLSRQLRRAGLSAQPKPEPVPRPAAISDERPAPRAQPMPPPQTARASHDLSSLEVTIGAKWFSWLGVVLVIAGVMFFLKYAYDNNWIGPLGRISVAALGGAAALVFGERFRRAAYPVLFHTLTGGGLAIFYGCIYFSFQLYSQTGQSVSFALSIAVTVLAVAISVTHDAPGICLLGQLGGFLSPILLSTGTNRPVQLFSFVTVLNLATIGCAYFKNWRYVNAAGFIGTWALYAGWTVTYYDASRPGVALAFSALFYAMFLIAPLVQAYTRRQPLSGHDIWLVAAVIFVELVNTYALLHERYRPWLGLTVVMQALTVAAVYAEWTRRFVDDHRTRTTLLFFALALITAAIPIQLRLYSIPIGWAIEALMLGYAGRRYRSRPLETGALCAAVLATMGLLLRLPLHTVLFTPVFNRPFGSWITVAALTFALYAVLKRNTDNAQHSHKGAVPAIGGLALVLFCAVAHMEVAAFWTVRSDQLPGKILLSHQYTSLSLLWTSIPLLIVQAGRRGYLQLSIPAAFAAYAIGTLVLINNAFVGGWIVPSIPFFNLQWLSRFSVVLSIWIGLNWTRANAGGWTVLRQLFETTGHVVLMFLCFVEVNSWISASRVFSPFMRFGIVSALWSLQALFLIAFGLATRSQFRRVLGFFLFAVTIAKLLVVDMAVLLPVYRILSFAATGVLLIAAAYLYQRFAKALLESPRESSPAVRNGAG